MSTAAALAAAPSPDSAPAFGGIGRIPRGEVGRLVLVAFAFYFVLASVYQTMTLTDVTDDVIRLGIEADSYDMIWASAAWGGATVFGIFLAMPLAGRYGSRIVLMAGLAMFAVGNLLCGASVSLATMIVARIIEGIGKGLTIVMGRSTLYQQFDRTLLFAIGFYGVAAYSTRHVSPMFAAILNEQLSWRWIYWGNVPVALLALVGVFRFFRPNRPATPRIIPADWVNITLAIAWFVALMFAFGWYRRWGGWGSNSFAVTAILCVALPIVIAYRLLSNESPDKRLLRLVRSRVYILAMLVRMLMLLHMSAVLTIMGKYLVELRGYPRPLAGLIMAPSAVTMATSTALTLVFHRRALRHVWLVVGVVGGAACLWWLATIDNYTPKGDVALMLGVWGIFIGLFPPVFLTDEVEGQSPQDAIFSVWVSLSWIFLMLLVVPTATGTIIKEWTDRAEDTTRLNIRANRPEVEHAVVRLADHFKRSGLPAADASSATKMIIGQYVARESVVRGLRWGLQCLSLIMLTMGLAIASLLAWYGRNLHAPPDSGYS